MTGTVPRAASRTAAPPLGALDPAEHDLHRLFDELADSRLALLRRPRVTARAVADARALPTIHVAAGESDAARVVRRELRREEPLIATALHAVRAAVEVTAEPRTPPLLRGLRAAESRGLVVEPVGDLDSRRALMARIDDHAAGRCEHDLLGYDLWFVVRDAAGAPIALAVTPVDGDVAVLRCFRTLQGGEDAEPARFLLLRALTDALRARGVRHLVDRVAAVQQDPAVRRFQRAAGFRLVRVALTA